MNSNSSHPSESNLKKQIKAPLQEFYDAVSIPKDNLQIVLNQKSTSYNSSLSFIELKRLANGGCINSQYEIGLFYFKGIQVLQSYKSALHYFQLATDQGHDQASHLIGICYKYGLGEQQSYEKALYYFKLAVERGNTNSLAELGKMYERGLGVEQSYEQALKYYQLAADQDNHIAFGYLAKAYEEGILVKKSQEKANFYHQKKFEFYKSLADDGDCECQYMVGEYYEEGIGIEKSLEKAFDYYKKAADQKYLSAFMKIAKYFELNGDNEKSIQYYELAAMADNKDVEALYYLIDYSLKYQMNAKAVSYLKLLISYKNSPALVKIETEKFNFTCSMRASCEYELAQCFEKGTGVKQSFSNAVYYYELAAEHGNLLAQHHLGNAYLEEKLGLAKSPEKAIKYYQLAADQKDALAIEILGKCYEEANGVEKSLEKAFEYYKMAADMDLQQGRGHSLYQLARCYEQGIGIEQNLEQAIYYYKVAAENGFYQGYYRIGICYEKLGGEENLNKAKSYFKIGDKTVENKRSSYFEQFCSKLSNKKFQQIKTSFSILKQDAKIGNIQAQIYLADAYEKGNGVEKSQGESLKYYKLAADQGYGPAQIKLADYYNSEEVKDYKKAFEYYKKAADQGYAEAQCNVGFHYRYGDGVEKNASKAIQYYKLSADQGYNRALCNFADCYEDGFGVEKSSKEVFKYYQLAADHGYARGQFNLARCYRDSIGVEGSLEKAIEYYRLALDQEYMKEETLKSIMFCEKMLKQKQKLRIRKIQIIPKESLLYTDAKKLDTSEYTKDRRIEVLKNIFINAKNNACYLIGYRELNNAEIEVVRDAMMGNPKFTFVCLLDCIPDLYQSFEKIGYNPENHLKAGKFQYTNKDFYGFSFIGEAA